MFGVGSSLFMSGPETPYKFALAEGGATKAVGDEITGLLVQPGNQDNATMAVFARNSSGMLYGTSSLNWKYVSFANPTGCLPYMAQNLDRSYVFDDRGIMSISASQEYGNFVQSTLTANIDTYLNTKKSLAKASCVS